MTINEFLRKFRRVEHGMNVTRPRVLCADGLSITPPKPDGEGDAE